MRPIYTPEHATPKTIFPQAECHVLFDHAFNIRGMNGASRDFFGCKEMPLSFEKLQLEVKQLSTGVRLSANSSETFFEQHHSTSVELTYNGQSCSGRLEQLDGKDGLISLNFLDFLQKHTYLNTDTAFKMSRMLDGTQAGTWEWNIQTGELILNEQWANIIGYRLDELHPISIDIWGKLAHPDDLLLSNLALEEHFSGKKDIYNCEVRMRHKQGHWIWVRDYGRLLTRTEDGKPEWISGTHIDITAQKELQAKLEATQTELDAIITSTPAVIYKSPRKNMIEHYYISNDVVELTGYSAQETFQIKAWWRDRIHIEDLPQCEINLQNWVEQGALGILKRRYRFRHKDGHYIWLSDEARLNNEDFVGSLSDISQTMALSKKIESLAAISPGVLYQYQMNADGSSCFPYTSEKIFDLIGVRSEQLIDDGAPLFAAMHRDDWDRVYESLNHSLEAMSDWICEMRFVVNGQERYIYAHSQPVHQQDGSILWSGILMDMSVQKRLEMAQKTANLGYWEYNLKTREFYWSDVYFDLLGLDKTNTQPSIDLLTSLTPPDEMKGILEKFKLAGATGDAECEHQIKHASGELIWFHLRISKKTDDQILMGATQDITQRKTLEFKLRQESITDPLTGQFNRRHFIHALEQEFERFSRSKKAFVLIMMDFDDFKQVNDQYGHNMGDAVLTQVSSLVTKHIRSYDVFARLGGDEFALLLPNTDLGSAAKLQTKLLNVIASTPVNYADRQVIASVSMGLVMIDSSYDNIDALIHDADQALYLSKKGKQ